MELVNWLAQNRNDIVGKWLNETMAAYPTESLAVFEKNKDQFTNPLPHIISENIGLLFDELLKGFDSNKIAPALDGIVKIKAVQEFTPSQAIGFIYDLKPVIRKKLAENFKEGEYLDELLTIESEIDKMALLSFDIYTKCREKLYEIRANEIRNQTHMLIRTVNELGQKKEER
jgi:hypothetical protein